MRNTIFKTLMNATARQINDAINQGIEPAAIGLMMRELANQCDALAVRLEAEEARQEEERKIAETEESVTKEEGKEDADE